MLIKAHVRGFKSERGSRPSEEHGALPAESGRVTCGTATSRLNARAYRNRQRFREIAPGSARNSSTTMNTRDCKIADNYTDLFTSGQYGPESRCDRNSPTSGVEGASSGLGPPVRESRSRSAQGQGRLLAHTQSCWVFPQDGVAHWPTIQTTNRDLRFATTAYNGCPPDSRQICKIIGRKGSAKGPIPPGQSAWTAARKRDPRPGRFVQRYERPVPVELCNIRTAANTVSSRAAVLQTADESR